ncbi:hypothetical protein [Mycobacterium simiae]|nr:hypothetical protein [Mycobacterium simiae]
MDRSFKTAAHGGAQSNELAPAGFPLVVPGYRVLIGCRLPCWLSRRAT